MKEVIVRAAGFAFIAGLSWTSYALAAGDTTTISDEIYHRYPKKYGQGRLDSSWCYHVEMETNYKVWTVDNQDVVAKRAARIQTIYFYAKDGKSPKQLNYSSIFLAIVNPELHGNQYYEAGVLGYFPVATKDEEKAEKNSNSETPNNDIKIMDCPEKFYHKDGKNMLDFDFLRAYLLPFKLKEGGDILTVDEQSDWEFLGRTHHVYGITKYTITLIDPKGGEHPNTILLVGYGGGSGP